MSEPPAGGSDEPLRPAGWSSSRIPRRIFRGSRRSSKNRIPAGWNLSCTGSLCPPLGSECGNVQPCRRLSNVKTVNRGILDRSMRFRQKSANSACAACLTIFCWKEGTLKSSRPTVSPDPLRVVLHREETSANTWTYLLPVCSNSCVTFPESVSNTSRESL